MAQRARISLSGTDPKKVDSVCGQIKAISQRTGVAIRGPIPLPTKHLKVPVRKSPADERALRQLMRINVPDGVNIEIVLRS
jgi:small subunit ribosomal protein S10